MSPVSSSTPTCASARWRNARGSMSNSGSGGFVVLTTPPPAAGSASVGVVALTGHGLDVDESGPRLHHPRQQRVVLAQRVALELRREVEVAERGMAVEHEAVHLPALALVPVGARVDRHPRLHEEGVLVDVGLQRDAPVARRRLHAREHLEAAVGSGGAVGGLGRLHRRRRVAAGVVATFLRCRHPVDAGDEREEVAVERALGDLGGGAPVDAPDAHDGHAEHVGPVDHGLAQRGLEAARPARRALASSACGSGATVFGRLRLDCGLGCVGRPAQVTQRRSAPHANAVRARGCRCPRSGCAPGGARSPGSAPRAAAGSRGRRRRRA